jgi:hypothetical protein
MLGDAGLRDRAPTLYGPQRIAAAELLLGRLGGVEVLAGDDPLRQVVDALEAVTAGDDQLARCEEVLEGALGRLPRPHLARRATALECARGQGAALADGVEDVPLGVGILPCAAPPVLVHQVHHAPLEERIVLDGQ